MKILMPYKIQNGISIHDKSVVSGGIEKFCKSLFHLFPNSIIPLEISEKERVEKQTKAKIEEALTKFKYDILLLNYDELIYNNYFWNKFAIPIICIVHSPLIRHIRYLKFGSSINNFMKSRGHVYYVSQNQYNFFVNTVGRLENLRLQNKTGLINPSYCTDEEQPSDIFEYDAITIGRSDSMKNPFWVHSKLHKTDLKTCVITNKDSSLKGDIHHEYIEKNEHWKYPQTTFRGISYKDTMKELAKSVCYISTCPHESWGITVLEALAHGVPCILMTTDKSTNHSSAEIAALPSHIKILSKKCSPTELKGVIEEFKSLSFFDRLKISKMTKEKHSEAAFKQKLIHMFEYRLQDVQKSKLENLFQ